MQKIISWLFAALFFLVPLVLWPFTSEVFEFNKMVLVYILTILITSTWATRMIIEKKFIFSRTILDIPLLVFIGTQAVSTIFSIDPLTSLLGYYSRFNGGLASIVCYALLYWAFVSNLDKKATLRTLYSLLISAVLVSIYGVLEHFGIDKNIWQQDVQSRIFSTLGQPNWLAAWLIALIPITWSFLLNPQFSLKNYKFYMYLALSVLFAWTMIFTKSRSGYLGFATAGIVFWIPVIWKDRKQINKFIIPLVFVVVGIIVPCLISGTQWTPSIKNLIEKKLPVAIAQPTGGTALETGGTESGLIRKIVWKGAVDVWKHYPVFGTGVETFAYSYYLYRPTEHNLTSEWDFIYNKAHNEYLNFAANSGTVGILAYLALIGFIVYSFVKPKSDNQNINYGLMAGFISILVTNYFGFSVVPIQLLFFLFPAMAFALTVNDKEQSKSSKYSITNTQKTAIAILLLSGFYLLIMISRYWYADVLYASGKSYNAIGKADIATNYLTRAIKIVPNQPLFHSELATSYVGLALAFNQQKDTTNSSQLSDAAIAQITKAVELSPSNVNFKRIKFSVFVMLSTINPNYLISARDALASALEEAPTDAKLYYNLALIYARTGQTDLAIQTLSKTIDMKANYKEARLAYAILLIDTNQKQQAQAQLEYILTKIDPNDSLTKQTLESIK